MTSYGKDGFLYGRELDEMEDNLDDLEACEEEEDETGFCLCGRENDEDMIMCESEQCPSIWYHYECAGFPNGNVPEELLQDDVVWICIACKGDDHEAEQSRTASTPADTHTTVPTATPIHPHRPSHRPEKEISGVAGAYTWSNGESLGSYTNWAVGQPDNRFFNMGGDCAEVMDTATSGEWSTTPCSSTRKFICEKEEGTCPDGWRLFRGSCYQFNTFTKTTWSDSKHICEAQGAFLVSIYSDIENNYMISMFEDLQEVGITDVWIGVSDYVMDGQFKWSEGSSVSYENWNMDQPMNTANQPDCGTMYTGDSAGKWSTSNCFTLQAFVCKVGVGHPVTPLQPDLNVGTCPAGWSLNADSCYYIDTNPVTFDNAEIACESMGAKLTSIHTDEDQTYHSLRASMAVVDLWIGLHDISDEGNFVWVDETPVDFLNWGPGQPDNYGDIGEDCVHMNHDEILAGLWNDQPCTASLGYICKKAKDCEQLTVDETEDEYNYRYHPSTVNVEMIEFEVKASNDVHISLSPISSDAPEVYEIVIGGWGNMQSVIRRCIQCDNEVTVSTPGYLSADEFRGFWIKFDLTTGLLQVGREGNAYFMQWQDPNPLDVQYVGYTTGFGSTGVFRFCDINSGVDATPKPDPTPIFDARCGLGWEYDDTTGQCFLFRESDYRTWDDARQQCLIGGGDLISITSPEEQAYISARTALVTEWALWIGANDISVEGGWQWSDGAPFRYLNWNPGEPNDSSREHCAEMYVYNGKWNDNKCESMYGYICKKNGYLISHFRVSPNTYLDGYNRLHLTNVYPEDCAKRCVGETGFECLSFDYNKATMECDIADYNQDLGGSILSDPNFDYYQLIDVPATLPPTTLQPSYRCESGWDGYGSYCYQFMDFYVEWQSALTECRVTGGDLVSILDKNENEFVFTMMQNAGATKIWLGLNDKNRANYFEWTDDSEVSYTIWDAGEPNNFEGKGEDCVEMYSSGGWNDFSCDDVAKFVCKRRKQDLPPTKFPITPSGCDAGWVAHESSCYLVEESDTSDWNDAILICLSFGGNLLHIGDRFEQSVLTSQLGLQDGSLFWIGLSDTETPGQYKWSDGRSVSFTHWDKGQPDNSQGDCVASTSGTSAGLWRDNDCNEKLNYVCETLRAGYTMPPTQKPPPTNPSNTNCAPGWIGYGSQCFQVTDAGYDKTLSWDDARSRCVGIGGELASFHSSEEEQYIIASASVSDINAGYWIGLHDSLIEGGFEWSDGTPVEHTNWEDGEPNDVNGEDCVETFFSGRGWNDISCTATRSWICRIPKGVTPVTTIAPPTTPPWPTCPNAADWYLFNNDCYYFSAVSTDSRKSWKEANTYCMNNGGYLASIHGSDVNSFLKTFADRYTVDSYWIGLREYAASGKYEWSDSSPLDYQMWSTGEPNDFNGEEECAQFYIYDATWNDLNCGDRIPFICKKTQGSTQPVTHAPTPAPPGNCPGPSVRFNNVCYWFNGGDADDWIGWQEARDKCASFSGNGIIATLATIHTQEIQSFLNSQMRVSEHRMWIGLSDITNNNQFRWADGTAVDFTYWASDEPNEADGEEDCVEMYYDVDRVGQWNDVSCTKLNGYICQHIPSTDVPPPEEIINDCKSGYTQYFDSCFKVSTSPVMFSSAVDQCENEGTYLASITSAYEQAFVETLVHTTGDMAMWIGLNDNEESGVYQWVDGWPVWYTNWGLSEPSKGPGEGCVAVMYNGDWDDTACDYRYKPLCKYSFMDTPTNPPDAPGICEEGWTAYGSSCYQHNYGEDATSWPEAEFYCTKQGGFVASVHSKQENEWIRTVLAAGSTEDIWIGLHRTDSGGFEWEDNTAVQYVNWAQNEPSYTWDGEHENCVEMYSNTGLWNDQDCLQRQSYVCKKAKITTVTGQQPMTTDPGVNPPNKQSAKPQTGSLSSGGIIGVILAALALILVAGLIIFFVVTRTSSSKDTALDIGSVGFDNALYNASKGTVQVKEKKDNDIAVISDMYDPSQA